MNSPNGSSTSEKQEDTAEVKVLHWLNQQNRPVLQPEEFARRNPGSGDSVQALQITFEDKFCVATLHIS